MSEVWDHAPSLGTSNNILMLIAMADMAGDDDRMMWLSVPTLVRRTGMSRATAYRCLDRLESGGFIETVPEKDWPPAAYLYKAIVRRITPVSQWPSSNSSQNETVDTLTSNSLTVRPNPTTNLSTTLLQKTSSSSEGAERDLEPRRETGKGRAARLEAEARAADPFQMLSEAQEGPSEPRTPPPSTKETPQGRSGRQKGAQRLDTAPGLAVHFKSATTGLGWGLETTNVNALAKHFSTWMEQGTTADDIRAMIRLYVNDPGVRNDKVPPWKDFMSQRFLLRSKIAAVQESEASAEQGKAYWL